MGTFVWVCLAFFAGVLFSTFTIGVFIHEGQEKQHGQQMIHVLKWCQRMYNDGNGKAINDLLIELEVKYGID